MPLRNAATSLLFILAMGPVLFAESSADNPQRAPRFALNVEAGIGYPEMPSLRYPFDPLALSPHLVPQYLMESQSFQNYSLDVEYLIRAGIGVGLGYEFLNYKEAGQLWIRTVDLKVPTHGIFAVVDKRWRVLRNPFKLELHCQVKTGQYLSFYKHSEPEWQNSLRLGGGLVPAIYDS